MRFPMRLRSGIAAAALAATTALMVNGPAAHAAYDFTACHAPPGGTCVTGAIQPHSTQHWLRIFVDPGNNIWGVYDHSEGDILTFCQGEGQPIWCTCYGFDPSHYYELWVGSGDGANGYLANTT